MKIIALTTIMLLYSLFSYSRGYYELKFYSTIEGVRTNYTGLLLFYDDSSKFNKLRVIFNDVNGEKILVEEGIKVQVVYRRGVEYRALIGYSPIILRTNSDRSAIYSVDTFLFKKGANGYFEPDRFLSTIDEYGRIKGQIIAYKPMNNLKNNYLRQFDWRVTPELTPRYDSLVAASSHNPPGKTIHLILLSDTADSDLGRSCSENERQLIYFFQSAATVAGNKFEYIQLGGKDFGSAILQHKINNLQVKANDGIIFYYSGHGFRVTTDSDSFPIIDFRKDKLVEELTAENTRYLKLVNDELKKKNPQFLISIGECCNRDLNVNLARNEALSYDKQVALAPTRMPLNKLLVAQLFSFRGNLLVSSAHPHQESYYYRTDGGIFWNKLQDAFFNSLCVTNVQGSVSWADIIQTAASNTDLTVNVINSAYKEMAVWYLMAQ